MAAPDRGGRKAGAYRAPRIGPPARLAVDIRGSVGLVGRFVKYLSIATLFPLALALGYGESPWPFVGTLLIAGAAGLALERLGGSAGGVGFREGYFVVSLTWLLAAAVGALPYLLSGEAQLANPVDAYFESMSGFTTTGSSVLTDIEGLDRSLLMWRQFTQWLGGMGIIVLAIAVLPRLRVGGRQLLETELPGPDVESLGERIRQTAQHLWLLYVALTGALALILTLVGISGVDDRMGLYEAVAHAFTTMPTGGFGTFNRSVQPFSATTEWVLVLFMAIAGINFALMYRAFARRRPALFVRDEELRVYLLALAVSAAILVGVLYTENIAGSHHALRHGAFQAVSIVTTTGYASLDFSGWTTLALITLVGLMFVGGSAGSTAGSVKVIRHLLLAKTLRREVRLTVRPELVEPVRFNGSVVDEKTLRAVIGFALLYLGLFIAGAGVLALDSAIQGPTLNPLQTMAAAATTLGNVGPGLGPAGPMDSFATFSDASKLTLIALMWLGRLEVIPVLVILTRRYWRV